MSNVFECARNAYQAIGVDVEQAFARLDAIPVSVQCWQADDVAGFESSAGLDGGIAVTGNYPGRARNGDELRADFDFARKMIPGALRLNLHAIYAETNGRKVERDELQPEHFSRFADWAAERGMGLDFNPTYFSHPMAATGFTLSSPDAAVRDFWVRHGIACRKIGEAFGKQLGKCCITNFWIPDGYKDTPVDRVAPRERLIESLDRIFAVDIDRNCDRDAVECKLFGIGSESYVTGSHEFYMNYALSRKQMVCLDAGHFHPTETIADKIGSLLLFFPELLLHVSRGVRWDSDHVVVLNDDLKAIAREVVRGGCEDRVHVGLDYFDASINRLAAWIIGARSMKAALLMALLEPAAAMAADETAGDYTARLAMQEELKMMPFGAIWAEYCRRHDTPEDIAWLKEVRTYEKEVLANR
ncbi:MAG: L-rhamnose isomerase [Lentisphaeria bacterium]|nr:L-rhamnose isomerase [Lentisphaeria bacterium]